MLLFIYFNPIIGPDLLYSVPENIDEALTDNQLNQIKRLMDASSPGFFSHNFSEEVLTANLFFMLPSNWARGKQEMVVVTKVVEEENPNLPQYKKRFLKFKKALVHAYPEIYKALYIHNPPENYKDEVKENFSHLKKEIKELAKTFQIRDTQTIGKLYPFDTIERKKAIHLPNTVLEDLDKGLGDNKKNYFLVYQKSGEYVLRFIPVESDRVLKVIVIFKGQLTPFSLKKLSDTFPNLGIPLIFTSGICQETGTGKCIYEAYFDPKDHEDFEFIRKEISTIPNIFELKFTIINLD